MKRVIDISEEEFMHYGSDILGILLKDRTTDMNILWATDDYEELGEAYLSHRQITKSLITGRNKSVIQPRIYKDKKQQTDRTKKNAEVFTPSWVCNSQNNLVDEAWFGKKEVFNSEKKHGWTTIESPIEFELKGSRTWKKYIDTKRMEVACGEAPYLVSRYDASTGRYIEIKDRIGLLDRKFRVVNENCKDEELWLKWAKRAVESIYGFEFQGDSLLLARENVLFTFIENMEYTLNRKPTDKELKDVAIIISWNIWQMDGLNYTIPYSDLAGEENRQITLFDMFEEHEPATAQFCKTKDWRAKEIIEFRSLVNNKGVKY